MDLERFEFVGWREDLNVYVQLPDEEPYFLLGRETVEFYRLKEPGPASEHLTNLIILAANPRIQNALVELLCNVNDSGKHFPVVGTSNELVDYIFKILKERQTKRRIFELSEAGKLKIVFQEPDFPLPIMSEPVR